MGESFVETITDYLWRIDCRTRDRPNAYLLAEAGGGLTLIDSGWPGDAETVSRGVEAAGFALAEIDRVLLTHYDIDHVGSLGRLTPELDAPVYVHPFDAAYVAGEQLPPLTARWGIEALHRLLYRRLDLPDLPIRRVDDGDTICGFEVVHTPGHTPGHVAYVHEDRDAVFLGDLAVGWGNGLKMADRLTSYDAGRANASARDLLGRAPEFDHACPGHGPVLADGAAKLRTALE